MSINDAEPKEWDEVFKENFKPRKVQKFTKHDPVERPHHYNTGNIEAIDAIKESMEPQQFKGYLKGNTMKYLWRYEYKGGVEDLRKAKWYLERLIAEEIA